MPETLSSRTISPKLQRIARLARKHPQWVFTTLAHLIDQDLLREAYQRTRTDGAVGVDGQTARRTQPIWRTISGHCETVCIPAHIRHHRSAEPIFQRLKG